MDLEGFEVQWYKQYLLRSVVLLEDPKGERVLVYCDDTKENIVINPSQATLTDMLQWVYKETPYESRCSSAIL